MTSFIFGCSKSIPRKMFISNLSQTYLEFTPYKSSDFRQTKANFTRQSSEELIYLEFVPYKNSDFNQIRANFISQKSKELVFKIISNLKLTTKWFSPLEKVEVIKYYDHDNFLLRLIINPLWPLKKREIIACVNTIFHRFSIEIKIQDCSKQYPINVAYERIKKVKSTWLIEQISSSQVQVSYSTWLEPGGHIPAVFYNMMIRSPISKSLIALQKLIETASFEDGV